MGRARAGVTFEEFWRINEKEIASRCYSKDGWTSPYEIARVVFEIQQRGEP